MNPANHYFTLDGGDGWGPEIQGTALVSIDHFGVRYDLDPETGIISNRDHDLYGQSIADRILVFAGPKGGVAASWSLASLVERQIAPRAIIFREASPIFVQGCLFAGIALMHRLSQDPCTKIRSGDLCKLFPGEGRIEVSANAT